MTIATSGPVEGLVDDAITLDTRASVPSAPSPSSPSLDRAMLTCGSGPDGDDAEDAFLDLLARPLMFWC